MLPKLDIYAKTEQDFRLSLNRLETHRLNNPEEAEALRHVIISLQDANGYLKRAMEQRKETV